MFKNFIKYALVAVTALFISTAAFAQDSCVDIKQLDAMAVENNYVQKATLKFDILQEYVRDVHGLEITEGIFDVSVSYFPLDETDPLFIVFYLKDGCVVEKQVLPKEEFDRVMDYINHHKG